MVGLADDGVEGLPRLAVVFGHLLHQQLGEAAHHGEGRPQLVGQEGHGLISLSYGTHPPLALETEGGGCRSCRKMLLRRLSSDKEPPEIVIRECLAQ